MKYLIVSYAHQDNGTLSFGCEGLIAKNYVSLNELKEYFNLKLKIKNCKIIAISEVSKELYEKFWEVNTNEN